MSRAAYEALPRPDMVDHPSHYGGKDNPYEVVKVMEAWLSPEEFRGAMKFNIHKYLASAGKKNYNPTEDEAKAAWYAAYLKDYNNRLVAQMQAEEKLK